jgi:phosphonopyruvate decarboxylase
MTALEPLPRKQVVDHIARASAPDAICVSSFGSASYYLFEAGDRPLNLYTFGGMGQASSLALGLALAQPEREVVVIDGDGALLMNLSILGVIAAENPARFLHVVLDDGAYESTGGQPTATGGKLDLVRVAEGCGIANARRVLTESQLVSALGEWKRVRGPMLLDVRVRVERGKQRPRFDPLYYRYRFQNSLLEDSPNTS